MIEVVNGCLTYVCRERLTDIVVVPPWVTSIAEGVFKDCKEIGYVVLPEGLISIGKNAFAGSSICCVHLPETLSYIGEGAFQDCTSLTEVQLSCKLASIEPNTFRGCKKLTKVTLPKDLVSIGQEAFKECSSLVSITFPETLTSIGQEAFTGCRSLKYFTLPETLIFIGKGAFGYCDALVMVTWPASLPSISEGVFQYCKELISVTVSDNLTSVEASAFRMCKKLERINLPHGLISIKEEAFHSCKLSLITLPLSLAFIGDYAFIACSFREINIPINVEFIGSYAFSDCNNLQKATFFGKTTSIPDGVFKNCVKLISFIVPEGVIVIGCYAFKGCKSLEKLSLPSSLNSIEFSAFDECRSLTEVKLPEVLTRIAAYAFADCNGLTKMFFSSNITYIGERAFSNCKKLAKEHPGKEVILPAELITLGDSAFLNCVSIKALKIGDKLKQLGSNAFQGCLIEFVSICAQDAKKEYLQEAVLPKEKYPSLSIFPTLPKTVVMDGLSLDLFAMKKELGVILSPALMAIQFRKGIEESYFHRLSKQNLQYLPAKIRANVRGVINEFLETPLGNEFLKAVRKIPLPLSENEWISYQAKIKYIRDQHIVIGKLAFYFHTIGNCMEKTIKANKDQSLQKNIQLYGSSLCAEELLKDFLKVLKETRKEVKFQPQDVKFFAVRIVDKNSFESIRKNWPLIMKALRDVQEGRLLKFNDDEGKYLEKIMGVPLYESLTKPVENTLTGPRF